MSGGVQAPTEFN